MIPHQLNEDFYRILIVHFICCLKVEQPNKLYRVVSSEYPVKVESLNLDLTERILHIIFFKAEVVLFNQSVGFLYFKLLFLLEKIIQPSAIFLGPILFSQHLQIQFLCAHSKLESIHYWPMIQINFDNRDFQDYQIDPGHSLQWPHPNLLY